MAAPSLRSGSSFMIRRTASKKDGEVLVISIARNVVMFVYLVCLICVVKYVV